MYSGPKDQHCRDVVKIAILPGIYYAYSLAEAIVGSIRRRTYSCNDSTKSLGTSSQIYAEKEHLTAVCIGTKALRGHDSTRSNAIRSALMKRLDKEPCKNPKIKTFTGVAQILYGYVCG